jgi:hypothetical protein
VRVRDHIAVSTALTALLAPVAGRAALGLWAGGVLIDADHYLWFAMRRRRMSPAAAVRFFDEADPPRHVATRALHSPPAVLALAILAARRHALLPVALGVGGHVALDARHDARMDAARAAALARDDFSCRACGARGPDVGTHLRSQPALLPSYAARHHVALCASCHEAAHRGALALIGEGS